MSYRWEISGTLQTVCMKCYGGWMEGKGAENDTKNDEKMMRGKKGREERGQETVKDGGSKGEGG